MPLRSSSCSERSSSSGTQRASARSSAWWPSASGSCSSAASARWHAAPTRDGFLLALAAGGFIAGYTLVDKQGLEHAAPIPFIELVLIGPAIVYSVAIWRLRGSVAFRREATPGVALVGIVLFFTYVLVLFALRLAPAASVSAVRETSVVIASGVAALIAHEHVTGRRFAGAVLVAAGVALVALG